MGVVLALLALFCVLTVLSWIISIPIAILFLKLQKYYVNGMAGAVKG